MRGLLLRLAQRGQRCGLAGTPLSRVPSSTAWEEACEILED